MKVSLPGGGDGKFHYNEVAYEATEALFLYRMYGKPQVGLTPVPEDFKRCVKEGGDMHKAYSWLGWTPQCGYDSDVKFMTFLSVLRDLDERGIL